MAKEARSSMKRGKVASTRVYDKSILGKKRVLKNGKLDKPSPLAQPPKCPECNSTRVWKDGLRYPRGFKSRMGSNPIQRFLCRDCGLRFSESTLNSQEKLNITGKHLKQSDSGKNLLQANIFQSEFSLKPAVKDLPFKTGENVASHSLTSPTQTIVEKAINTFADYNRERRVCETDGVLKNLVKVETRQKWAAGATTKADLATIKGKIVEFAFWLDKQGYAESTQKDRVGHIKRLLDLGADLWNPETIKEILAKQKEWGNGYKRLLCYAYESFLQMESLTWERPKYKQPETLPFIPMETELDQLIASCGKKVSTFLQGLKDTGADPGELAKLRWIDINKETRTVNIRPVKGHNPRILPVSNDFINRLERLPKKGERVFKQETLNSMFYRQRKRLAFKLSNPRLLEISFTTFRHWKATMEYHRTKDILHVKHLLGHKNIQNTMIYIDLETALFNRTNDEFAVRVAHNIKEACGLVEAGFDYVTGEYNDGGKIFRKRK